MLHPPKTVRITEAGKASLSRIKKQSGIQRWNTLCRLARARLAEEGATMDAATAHERLRQHLHRGIHQLATLDNRPEALLPGPALPSPPASWALQPAPVRRRKRGGA